MNARRLTTLALMAALAALALPARPAQAAFPGGNGAIAFASDRDGPQEIYVMNPDGTSPRRLTTAGGEYPAWSADGNKLVFSSNREGNSKLFTMNPDGTAQTRLTDSTIFQDLDPSWSSLPLGAIAFRSNRENGYQIWVMNGNGTALQRLTDAGQNFNPVWSPTEYKIAFMTDRDGNNEIYSMLGDGSTVRNLTQNAAWDSNPKWSPDGTRIAFQSDRAGNQDVWIMNANGTGLHQLTTDPDWESAPAWSPDGTRIAYQRRHNDDFDIWVMNVDGSGQTPLTDSPGTDRVADWRPRPGVTDSVPPVLHLADVTTPATTLTGANVLYGAGVTDAVDPNPSITCTPASGSFFPIGATTVACTGTDHSGNWADGTFTVTVTSTPNTPVGVDIIVIPVDATTHTTPVTIRFSEVTVEGTTTLVTSATGPPPPHGFRLLGTYYEIHTTAVFDSAEVCFTDPLVNGQPQAVGHFDGADWIMFPIPPQHEVCVTVTSFSPFALFEEETPSDTTPPAVTISAPAQGATFTKDQAVAAAYACIDEPDGSGLATCDGPVIGGEAIDTGTVGGHSFTVTGTDNAGNAAALTHDYSVVYCFNGFYSPVDNVPVLNSVNGGKAIPVKFSLCGDQGLSIFAAGYPKSQQVPCDPAAAVDGVEETLSAGASSLSYDATADRYSYIWKTEKSWAGTCRQLVVKFVDGTVQRATFKFR